MTDTCWIWTAAKDGNGYGRFWYKDQMRLAHRISYLLFKNNFTDDLCILHTCNNPSCVNPEHLKEGTHAENMRDVAVAGTHGNRRLDPDKAATLRDAGWSLQRVADVFGVTKQAVFLAMRRNYGE